MREEGALSALALNVIFWTVFVFSLRSTQPVTGLALQARKLVLAAVHWVVARATPGREKSFGSSQRPLHAAEAIESRSDGCERAKTKPGTACVAVRESVFSQRGTPTRRYCGAFTRDQNRNISVLPLNGPAEKKTFLSRRLFGCSPLSVRAPAAVIHTIHANTSVQTRKQRPRLSTPQLFHLPGLLSSPSSAATEASAVAVNALERRYSRTAVYRYAAMSPRHRIMVGQTKPCLASLIWKMSSLVPATCSS